MRLLEGTLAATWMLAVAILLTGNPAAAQSHGSSADTGGEEVGTQPAASRSPEATASDDHDEASPSSQHAGQPEANARPAPPPVAPRPYASGLTTPMSCGNPLCSRWAPPQVPYGRGLRPVQPAPPYHPFAPPVGFERPPQPETPASAKGFDFGRLTLEGLGGFGGLIIGSLIGYPLIVAGAFGGSEPLIYAGLVLAELAWAGGLHLTGQLLDVDGSFLTAVGGTLLGALVGGLSSGLMGKAAGTPGAVPLGLLAFGGFIYVPAVVYEWGAGVYDD